MRINQVNNISNYKPVFKGYRSTPNAFAAGATFRNQEDMDALIRSYADADSVDIATVGLFLALYNKTVSAAKVMKTLKSPEHQARVAERDRLIRAKVKSLNVEA